MSDVLWRQVSARCPKKLREQIPNARKFLEANTPTLAAVLSNPETTAPPNKELSTSDLVALVVKEVEQKSTDRFTAAAWLKIYGVAVREYNRMAAIQLPEPPRPIVLEPQPSPFDNAFDTDIRKADVVVGALHDAIAKKPSELKAGELLGAIALSAVVHGMLLDKVRLKLFVERLARGTPPELSFGCCSVLFALTSQDFGKRQDLRWYLDPVTELLVWHFLKLAPSEREALPEYPIKSFINSRLPKQRDLPVEYQSVVETFASWWLLRSSPTDIACARRRISWHSIDTRSYRRLFSDPRFDALRSQHAPAYSDSGIRHDDLPNDSFESSDVELIWPWFIEAKQLLEAIGATPDSVLKEVESLHACWDADERADIFLQWLEALLPTKSTRGKRLDLETIAPWFINATTHLLAALGTSSLSGMGTEDWVDIYGELLTDPSLGVQRQAMANGLQSFHRFLASKFGLKTLKLHELFPIEETQRPVDANLITYDDYVKACEEIDGLYKLSGQDRLACRLVLMLGFRCGLRRMEIFGLRLQDIHLGRTSIDILVTPNDFRRLKTNSSKRRSPAHALLDAQDRILFRKYVRERRAGRGLLEIGNGEFLLTNVTGNEKCQPWIDRIVDNVIAVLRKATGDKHIFLHHLRHSFGTWTYLSLRCAELPAATYCLERFPRTQEWLEHARRTRRLLLGNQNLGSRSVGFAVARLLGHSSPAMSFGHYIHSADLVGFGLGYRYCETLPIEVLIGASGFEKSTTYKHRSKSLKVLLENARLQLSPPELLHPPKEKGRGVGRPPKSDAAPHSGWLGPDQLVEVIEMLGRSDLEMDAIERLTHISKDTLVRIMEAAITHGRDFGLESDDAGRIQLSGSLRPRLQEAYEFLIGMSDALGKLSTSDRARCQQGAEIILQHYDPDKHDCIFRGAKNRGSLLVLCQFYLALGADPGSFEWVMRTYKEQPSVPEWVQTEKLPWQPAKVRRINPKSRAGAGSYVQWVGIFPVDTSGKTLGRAAALSALFAKINFSVM